jgi:DNA-binding MarR family transcriptional regulator
MKTEPCSRNVGADGLGAMLGLVRTEMVRAMEAELAQSDIDLRFTQFLILKRLARMGPMMATELARAIELDGGAMTRQLDQLEGRGYLRRSPHEQDRRALRIELTETGKAISAKMFGCSERVLAAAQRSLSADEQLQLNDYLERVLRALRDKA